MSGCERFGPELDSYFDGELEPRAHESFALHLGSCAECSRALETRSQLDRGIASLPPVEPSPQFEAHFWARVARAEDASGRPAAWLRLPRLAWVAGGATLAAVLAVLLTLRAPSLSEQDWVLVADAEGFELVLEADPELLATLDVLETWDGSEEI